MTYKIKFKQIICLIVIFITTLCMSGCAKDGISVQIDGKPLNTEVGAVIKDDRTFVPMRAIFEALGAQVEWDGSSQTVTGIKDTTKVSIKIGENVLYKNGEAIKTDAAAYVSDGRTMVPVRAVAQSFGCNVSWDDENSAVKITTAFAVRVHFMDVGQGDSAFIELPGNKCMLIDSGEREYADTVINYIKNLGYKTLNYVVATHPHTDHMGCMAEIINAFNIEKFYMPEAVNTSNTFDKMLDALANSQADAIYAYAGNTIFDYDGAKAVFLSPKSPKYSNLNDYSAVVKLTFKNSSFLFMGDAEKKPENEMLTGGYDLKADVLKAGHHGSNTSNTEKFIRAVAPKYAVISVGKENSYGHPHAQTLALFKTLGIKVYRTDENGTVIVSTDGSSYTIETLKNVIEPNAPNESENNNIESALSPDDTVYITKTGKKYHSESCTMLKSTKIKTTLGEAINKGLSPCSRCMN